MRFTRSWTFLASAAETALTSVSRIKIKNLVEEGDTTAQQIEHLMAEPNKFLTTILVVNNVAVSVLFLALAAGAIVYVIGELQHAGRKLGSHDLAMVGLLVGFLLAYGTDRLLSVLGS